MLLCCCAQERIKQVMLLCCGVQERIKQERQRGEEAATKRLTEQHQEEVRNLIAEHRRQVDALQRNDDDDFGQYTAAAAALPAAAALFCSCCCLFQPRSSTLRCG